VYVTRTSFAASAALITNTTLGRAGIVPSTACGLERWERLVSPNVTTIYTIHDTSLQLTGLEVAVPYEVNIVATCDDDCLRANAARLGYVTITTALSTQRTPYAVTRFQTLPPIVEAFDNHDESDPTTTALVPIGVILTVLLICVVAWVVYRQSATMQERMAAAAKRFNRLGGSGTSNEAVDMASPRGGAAAGAPVVTRDNADDYFKPRSPTIRRALVSSTSRTQTETEVLTARMAERYAAAGSAGGVGLPVPAPAPAPAGGGGSGGSGGGGGGSSGAEAAGFEFKF